MKRLTTILAAALMAALTSSSPAAIQSASDVQQDGNAIVLRAETETVRISVLTPDIIRVQGTKNDAFKSSLMVEAGFVKTDWPKCDFTVNDAADSVEIVTKALKVRVTKSPFAIELLNAAGTRLLKTADAGGVAVERGTTLNCELAANDHFFGFGYMRKCFDARGQTLTWTRSYRNNEATVPFFLNPRGYAFYSNNTWKNDFDFTGTNSFRIATEAGDLDFFLMVGADFARLLDLYTDLTGKPQLVPKWALGLEHRARYFDDAQQLLETARLFRHHNIPCEIMALEPGWEEKPYSMDWVWSKKRFPNPVATIQELKKMGYKFDLWESGAAPKVNFLNAQVRQDWFAKRAVALTNWGVDMFKQDDPYPREIKSVGMEAAEKSDGNVSDMKYAPGEIITVANSFYTRTAFEEWRKLTGRRPVIQFHAYNASVSSQRWPYQWAGDFGTGWGLFNASLSGHPMANADARSPYLDARHLDFFMSAGAVNDCWAYCIEPWSYSDRLLEGCRMYASLRVRLYPYLYSAMRDAHDTGTPIIRPMVFNDPRDPATYKMGSQFFIGDSLLVATSVELDVFGDHARINAKEEIPDYAERSTPVYFPRGTWIDYWTGKEYVAATNQWANCTFPSWTGGPLFVRAGAIIPTASVKHHTEQWPDELLTLDVYPRVASGILPDVEGGILPPGTVSEKGGTPETSMRSVSSTQVPPGRMPGSTAGKMPAATDYTLYEDDGITFGYEKSEFANTRFSAAKTGNAITVELGKREGNYPGKPAKRDYLLKIHSALAPAKVVVDGKELKPEAKDKILFNTKSSGWYYDAAMSKIIVKPRAGWAYVASGKNPAGTYPLTPAEERVTFTQKSDASAQATRIEITLNPDVAARVGVARRIVFEPENTRVLADGRSTVKIAVTVCDANGNVVPKANQELKLALKGGGAIPKAVSIQQGRGEIVFTAPAKPGAAQLSATGKGLKCEPLKLEATAGKLQLVVNPRMKVPQPGKGEWLAAQFTIAVSARDAAGNRLAAQTPVKLVIRDYKDRELIEREAPLLNGEAEFRNVKYQTRPEKFIITASGAGLETGTFKAFENVWMIPDNYYQDKNNKTNLDVYLIK